MNEDELRTLLRELDDPEHLELPADYDHSATRARFDRLAARLETDFRCQCDIDRHVEDASHHGRISIPAAATASGEHLTVVVSNFGRLAVATLGNPGSYDDEETSVLLHQDDRTRLERALADLDYVQVPEHLLWEPYAGPSDLGSFHGGRPPESWYGRFFDYL